MSSRKPRAVKSESGPAGFQALYQRSSSVQTEEKPRKWLGFLSILALFTVTAAFTWYSYVDTVVVEGTDDPQLKERLTSYAEDHYKFHFQVSSTSLNRLVSDFDIQVSGVSARPNLFARELVIVVAERRPVLRWQSEGSVFLIDEAGLALEKTDNVQQHGSLPVVVDIANLTSELGQQVVSRKFVDFAVKLADSGIDIKTMRIIETSSELHAELEAGYTARFATEESVEEQLENLSRVQAIAKDRGDSIKEYVDLRIPYKAYYR